MAEHDALLSELEAEAVKKPTLQDFMAELNEEQQMRFKTVLRRLSAGKIAKQLRAKGFQVSESTVRDARRKLQP